MKSRFLAILGAVFFCCTGCVQLPEKELSIKPDIAITTSEATDLITSLSRKFPKPSPSTLWGQEILCGWIFAQECDFFRAITCFRKAIIYMDTVEAFDPSLNSLRIEAITGIISSYILQKKYDDVIQIWDKLSGTITLQNRKEAKWLLIMLVQALSSKQEYEERAISLANMLPIEDPDKIRLLTYLALRSQSFTPCTPLTPATADNPVLKQTKELFADWQQKKKNPTLAFSMNCIVPGSGYAYLGQNTTAFTSFTINVLFIGAMLEFMKAHQPMAAIITLGLEMGWWAGGSIGARLATHEYNHRLWLDMAKKFMRKEHLYPEAILWRSLISEEAPAIHQDSQPEPISSTPITTTTLPLSWLIAFHQQVLSLGDGPRSHFYPTSSDYMKQAVMRHGITGYFLGMDRLLRENSDPWHYPLIQIGFSIRKYDPIPSK